MAAKKTARNLTQGDIAARNAQRLLDLRGAKSELEAQIEEVEDALIEHYDNTGETVIAGLLTVVERNNAPRISGAEGKRREMLLEKLIQELPTGYVREKRDLDIARMYASVDVDPTLRSLMKEAGLQFEQTRSIIFKALR